MLNDVVDEVVAQKAAHKLPERIYLRDLVHVASSAQEILQNVRKEMAAPHPRKDAPKFSLAQLAALCGLEKPAANYIVTNKDDGLPKGVTVGNNRRREFTLTEALTWVEHFAPSGKRPFGVKGKKVSVGNFKGGVTKTTSALALAQGLTLRGRKVLIIDLDPQGSLTTLMGILPDSEVEPGQTIMPLIFGDEDNLRYAVQSTYWKNLDLIAANGLISEADLVLPALQSRNPKFEFWTVIDKGVEPLLDDYDYVIFDTPPALSYITINAFMASDGIIVPSPPNAMDFASSVQFWSLFGDFGASFIEQVPSLRTKSFDFVNVLLSKVERNKAATSFVINWINKAYGSLVMPIEITSTSGALTAAAQFGTVYDIGNYSGKDKVYEKTRIEYDAFVEYVDTQVMALWLNTLEE